MNNKGKHQCWSNSKVKENTGSWQRSTDCLTSQFQCEIYCSTAKSHLYKQNTIKHPPQNGILMKERPACSGFPMGSKWDYETWCLQAQPLYWFWCLLFMREGLKWIQRSQQQWSTEIWAPRKAWVCIPKGKGKETVNQKLRVPIKKLRFKNRS